MAGTTRELIRENGALRAVLAHGLRGHAWIRRTAVPLLAALAAASTASVANATPHSAGSTPSPGLWLVADNGRIQSLGSAGRLVPSDIGWLRHNPVVAAASTPTGAGLWVAAEDSRVYSFGDANLYRASTRPRGSGDADVVAIAGTPDGGGYLLAFDDGQVQAYGDADSYGSAWTPHGKQHAIVGIALTPTGRGYWLAAADGQVYAFGDARRLGSSTNRRFDSRIVAIAATPAGDGVWLAGSDGRIVSLGAAPVFTTARHRGGHADVVGIAPTPSGRGLWLADADGSLETVGDAPPLGRTINGPGDVVAVASSSAMGTLTATVSDVPPGVAPDASATGAGVTFDLPATETVRVPAGEYDITARAVHSNGTTYWPTVDGSPATIVPGGSAAVTVDYLTAVPDTTKVVDAPSVQAATGDPATGVTLTLDAATAPQIAVGDVLALGITDATPYGLLGKVTAISTAGGASTVVTTPATLDEAITSGELDIHSGSASARRLQGLGLFADIGQRLECGADESVDVSGTVHVTPDVDITAQWGGVAHPLRLDATATVGVSESATLSLSAEAAATCKLNPITLGTPLRYVIAADVVGIPVIVDVEIQLELTASGRIGAAVETSVTQTLTAFVGARYHDGDFTPISGHHSDFTFERPAPVDFVELQVAVGPKVSVRIDGLAGPEASLHAGLDLRADPDARPPAPWWTLAGTIDAGIDFRASFKLWKVSFNFEKDVPLLSLSFPLAHATQPPPALISADPQEVLPGESVDVSGRGFGRNETVTIAFSGGPTLGTATTNSQGVFTKTINVPADASDGAYELVATGRRSGKTASTDLTVGALDGSLTVDPFVTSPGGTVSVSGDGFVGGETVDLDLDGTPLGSATAGSSGSFTKDVTIPADTDAGIHTIQAVGRRSHRVGSDDVFVGEPPPADLSVDPSTALPGDTVTVTGDNFGAHEAVALTFDDGRSLATVTADRRGAFTANVEVPSDATGGDHSILATGQAHGQTAEAAVHVNLPPPHCDGQPANNDSFASAITLDGSSGRICGTLVGAGVDPFELALDQTGSDIQQPPNFKPTRAVWFKWTAGTPPNGFDVADILIDSLGSPAPMSGNGSGSTPSAGPPWIVVWGPSSDDPSQLVPLGISWDGGRDHATGTDYTLSGARVHVGQTYWIEVGNIPDQTPDAGQFFLNWQETNED